MATSFRKYKESVDPEQLFKTLGASNPETLAKTVEHFTTNEADKRDKIVLGYFGQNGVDRIVDAIATRLLAPPKLPQNAKILDMGEHTFEEFKTEMGDIHMGFKLKNISEMARKHFSTVRVGKMTGISCKSSGRIAEIFIASMRDSS